MKHNGPLVKALAICGTVLVAFPIVAMLVTGIVGSIRRGAVMVDYLMPAELLPAVLVGGALLVASAWMMRARLALIGGTLVGGLLMLAAGMGMAVFSGLADGTIEPQGPWFVAVNAAVLLYAAAVAALAVEGVLLTRDAFRHPDARLDAGAMPPLAPLT